MEYTIQNEILAVSIKQKGAELFSVIHKQNNLEYMWSGDPAFWGKTSPVLFPIVGALRQNTYLFHAIRYSLNRHGFARDVDFEVEKRAKDSIIFLLRSSAESIQRYPFLFELRMTYTLEDNILHLTYDVKNMGNDNMYFSLGAHPAFKVPLVNGSSYGDHYLEFNKTENAPRWPISSEGLIEKEAVPLLQDTNTLPLTKSLFENDALVLKALKSNIVSLRSHRHGHGLEFDFTGFPFLGIWAAKEADFVCIEPWCGIADSVGHDQQLTSKEGIEHLESGERWSRCWSATFF